MYKILFMAMILFSCFSAGAEEIRGKIINAESYKAVAYAYFTNHAKMADGIVLTRFMQMLMDVSIEPILPDLGRKRYLQVSMTRSQHTLTMSANILQGQQKQM